MTTVPYIIANLTIWPINKCKKFITGCLNLVSCKTYGVHLLNIYDLLEI